MSQENLNLWIATIALGLINEMNEATIKMVERIQETEGKAAVTLKTKYNNNLVGVHERIHRILKQMTGDVNIPPEKEGEEPTIIIGNDLRSRTFLKLSFFLFHSEMYENSLEYAQKSFDLYPNQDAAYFIARNKSKIKVQLKAFSSSKAKDSAEAEKQEEVKAAYLLVVKIDPYSEYGIEAGQILLNKYDHVFIPEEISPD